ncbi:MAG: hypothetical protein IPM29_23100 [Planctomycetes bacterium]|nr:hypothetical protein [Planctomycetota bacterium]
MSDDSPARLRRYLRQRRPLPPESEAVAEALAPPERPRATRAQVMSMVVAVVLGALAIVALPGGPTRPAPTADQRAEPHYGVPLTFGRPLPVRGPLRAEPAGLAPRVDGLLVIAFAAADDDLARAHRALEEHWDAGARAASQWAASYRRSELVDPPAGAFDALAARLDAVLFPDREGRVERVGWHRLRFH